MLARIKLLPAVVLAWSVWCAVEAQDAVPEGVVTTKNIPYVEQGHPRQTLDLYVPAHPPGTRLPLVVWIHGGGWETGTKDSINVKYLLDSGYALASVDYRFSQDAVFPAQIQDCNTALNFLVKNAREYGLDPTRIAVAGGSAGGHLALLLGLARQEKSFGADPKFQPRAIIDFFGPTNLSLDAFGPANSAKLQESERLLTKLLGAAPEKRPDLAKAASPLTYISASAPPTMILQGDLDDIVPLAQSQVLDDALEQAGAKHSLPILPGAGHDGPAFQGPVMQAKVIFFLDSNLSPLPTPKPPGSAPQPD